MQIGMVGLGRMGGNIVAAPDARRASLRRLRREAPRRARRSSKDGATAAASVDRAGEGARGKAARRLADAAGRRDHRGDGRSSSAAFWSRDDIIIDGGNSFYKDDIRRAKKLAEKGIRYVDCGTSGGVWGIERGYCMMIGGAKEAVDHLDPIFSALAPGTGDIARTPGRDESAIPRRARLHPRRPVRRRALRQDGP